MTTSSPACASLARLVAAVVALTLVPAAPARAAAGPGPVQPGFGAMSYAPGLSGHVLAARLAPADPKPPGDPELGPSSGPAPVPPPSSPPGNLPSGPPDDPPKDPGGDTRKPGDPAQKPAAEPKKPGEQPVKRYADKPIDPDATADPTRPATRPPELAGDAPAEPPPDDTLPPPKQVDAPEDFEAAAAAATEEEAPLAGPGRCARLDSAADPMRLIDAVLDGLKAQGFEVGVRSSQTNLRGTTCAVRIKGGDPGFLHYQLQLTAEEGYVFALVPTGAQEYELITRAALENEDRVVMIARVEHVRITGRYRSGDSSVRLRKVLGLEPGTLSPDGIRAQLQQLGYRARYIAEGPGQLAVEVEPGRSIRRVRVHGHIPLSRSDVQRELSINARPGALAHGTCTSPKALRGEQKPALCAPDDLACARWRDDEIARLKRFMFDKGYLRGDASFGLSCGRKNDEVDLHVYLQKGPGYRVPWRQLTVGGNMPRADQRWIKRAFWPRVRATPFPARLTRDSIEESKERAERRYAEPRDNVIQATAAPQLSLPYPQIQIDTSYEDLRPGEVPPGGKLPLQVTVDLGRGVKTSFLGNRSYSDLRLRGQMQLFKRREAPSDQAAQREAANLRAYYQSKGFLLASVRGRYEEFGTTAPGALYFQISEGPLVTIRGIDQVITRGVPPRIAADIERDFDRERKLKRRGRLTEAWVIDDLTALLQRYQDRGYLCGTASVRVAFWPEGLDRKGEHSEVDVATILRREPTAAWATRDFDEAGLRELMSRKRANLFVRITVEPGPRVFTARRDELIRYLDDPIPGDRNVDDLPVHDNGAWGSRRIFADTPLRRSGDTRPGGVALTGSLDREVEEAVVGRYRDSGYPVADAEIRWIYTDPGGTRKAVPNARRLADPDIGMCQAYTSGTAVEVEPELSVYEGKKGTFGDTLLRGNFKTRGWVLRRQFAFRTGTAYNRDQSEQTRNNIDGLGLAESVTVTPYPVGCDLDSEGDECVVHQVVEMRESKDYAMNLSGGFGFATLDPFYLFLNPKFHNMWGTGWDFEVTGHYGFNTSGVPAGVPFLGDCAGARCYERSVRGNLTRQRIFGSPLTFDIGGTYQVRLTPARGRIESAIGTLTFTYPINARWQTYFGYLIQLSNISQDVAKPAFDPSVPPGGAATIVNRRDSIVSDRTGALQFGAVYTNVDKPFNPDKGVIASADLKLASPYLGGIDWFIRADLSFQHFIPIPRTNNRLGFRYALRYGHVFPIRALGTSSAPEIWRYFGGGTTDLGIRVLLPETMLVDIETVNEGGGIQRLHYTAQGGHIRALATIALQVVSLQDFLGGKIAHSLFFDFGVLTQKWQQVQFNRDFRRSVGVNFLKWDIKFVTLALGYAILIPNAIAPGNVKPIDDRNGRFIFDVGVTF